MSAIAEQEVDIANKKPSYLLRVNQLYSEIRKWLQDEPLLLESKDMDIIEALGHYKVPFLSIKTLEGEVLADFKPTGASALLAEGSIDVDGMVDRGYVLYMLASDPQTFFKIDVDGWYWVKARINVEAHLLNDKTHLLQLITWVSDYEF